MCLPDNEDNTEEEEVMYEGAEPADTEEVKGRMLAERIHQTIMKQILPKLESSLTTSVRKRSV